VEGPETLRINKSHVHGRSKKQATEPAILVRSGGLCHRFKCAQKETQEVGEAVNVKKYFPPLATPRIFLIRIGRWMAFNGISVRVMGNYCQFWGAFSLVDFHVAHFV
jgi:hypothetical protein